MSQWVSHGGSLPHRAWGVASRPQVPQDSWLEGWAEGAGQEWKDGPEEEGRDGARGERRECTVENWIRSEGQVGGIPVPGPEVERRETEAQKGSLRPLPASVAPQSAGEGRAPRGRRVVMAALPAFPAFVILPQRRPLANQL